MDDWMTLWACCSFSRHGRWQIASVGSPGLRCRDDEKIISTSTQWDFPVMIFPNILWIYIYGYDIRPLITFNQLGLLKLLMDSLILRQEVTKRCAWQPRVGCRLRSWKPLPSSMDVSHQQKFQDQIIGETVCYRLHHWDCQEQYLQIC